MLVLIKAHWHVDVATCLTMHRREIGVVSYQTPKRRESGAGSGARLKLGLEIPSVSLLICKGWEPGGEYIHSEKLNVNLITQTRSQVR